jgi:hypothetical protein
MAIRIRFVLGNDMASDLIKMQAGVSMPYTPSHCEALSQDGKTYIGARSGDGVQARPIDYDAGKIASLAEGGLCDRIVSLPCLPQEEDKFYAFVRSKIDEPYDWEAILGFAAPDLHTHLLDHIICSAFMTYGLRSCNFFPNPLTKPFHHITPDMLLLMLSSHVEVPH